MDVIPAVVDGGELEIGGGATQQQISKCKGWPSEKQNLASSKESTPAKDTGTTVKKNAYCVFICQRINLPGESQHAVCHECHEEHSKAPKRSRGDVPSEREMMMSCHHELRNLQLCSDIWWCTKDNIERQHWFERVKGCAFCERMFIVGDM